MSFTCFVLFDLFNAINCRSKDTSIFKIGFFTNKTFIYSVIASLFGQLLIIYIPFLNPIFQTTPLSFGELLSLLILTSTLILE
ncbi:hypothetical protein HZS_7653 [Henneguya salminicola]|nr:hypothetical protein HZS_7653 [Henneguya salminicola]